MHGYTQKYDDKNELINKNMNVVKKIAYYYVGRVHQVVEVEDLLQIGMVGLIEAAHNYKPHEGVVFENYARLRVKGAIIDFLRKSSNLCRGTIKRKQDFDKASRKLEIEHKRLPNAEETLKEMNKEFSKTYLQIPFIAKNQIVLIMYSNNIYKIDELTQKVRNLKNVKSADLFIPKKISFYNKWLKNTILDFKKSSKLHLTYQTN